MSTHFYDGVEGEITPAERSMLMRMASAVPVGMPILEVGSYRGASAIAMASAVKSPSLVYCVDSFPPFEIRDEGYGSKSFRIFCRNVADSPVGFRIRLVCLPSDLAYLVMPGPYGFLFIDGCHKELEFTKDLLNWVPLLQSKCRVAFHDTQMPSIKGPLRKHVERLGIRLFVSVDSLEVYQKD